ncbi:MAG: carboxymuconolactone decarboxylase family protein [Vulcanimicrobiaceae bacterium]
MRGMNSDYRSTLPKQDVSSPDERIGGVLAQAKQQVGMVPNMYAFMSNAPELLETYLFGYDRFRKDSGFTPVEQEVVFLTISFDNGCEYCMAAHSTIADGPSKVPKDVTDAIRANAPIADPKLAALSKLTRTLFVTRGRPSQSDVAAFLQAGYTEKHVLDIILALAVKTLSNYSNHVFATPVDPTFAPREWKSLAHSH